MSLTIEAGIQLYSDLTNKTINLWVWFVAGNFAAVAALFSVKQLEMKVRLAFIIGFVAYAAGNLSLLVLNLSVLDQLVSDLESYQKSAEAFGYFKGTLDEIVRIRTPAWIPVVFHLIVDTVIIVIALHKSDSE